MRRRRPKRYIDLDEEYYHQEAWRQTELVAKEVMQLFDMSPPLLKQAIDDTGVDERHAALWYIAFRKKGRSIAYSDKLAAYVVRRLIHRQHVNRMSEAARELQATGKALQARRRK